MATERDWSNGRFTFGGDLTRLCVCGHELAVHSGGAPHDCLSGPAMGDHHLPRCECQRFRLSRKQPVKEKV